MTWCLAEHRLENPCGYTPRGYCDISLNCDLEPHETGPRWDKERGLHWNDADDEPGKKP